MQTSSSPERERRGLLFFIPLIALSLILALVWALHHTPLTHARTSFTALVNSPMTQVSPTNLAFYAIEGGSNPPQQTLTLTVDAQTSWYVLGDEPWLSVMPFEGKGPRTLSVFVGTRDRAAGTYNGQITFYIAETEMKIPVTLVIAKAETDDISPENGGTASSEDGTLALAFPPGAVNDPTTVEITIHQQPPQTTSGYTFAGKSFKIEAKTGDSQPVTQFNQPLSLTVAYDDNDWQSAGVANESDLNLYWWNGSSWQGILPCDGCSHDTDANRIVVRLDHLTEFAVMAQQALRQIFLPAVSK